MVDGLQSCLCFKGKLLHSATNKLCIADLNQLRNEEEYLVLHLTVGGDVGVGWWVVGGGRRELSQQADVGLHNTLYGNLKGRGRRQTHSKAFTQILTHTHTHWDTHILRQVPRMWSVFK